MTTQPTRTPVTIDASSLALLERAQAGDADALNALIARYWPRLLRWAHGRLRGASHTLCDTEDLVQNTLIKAVRNLGAFEPGEATGLHNYLHLAIRNAVRDQLRKARRRPDIASMETAVPSDAPSPLECAMGRQRLARYEAALDTLSPEEREAIVARFEFGFTHAELAVALRKPTPDAARKICAKAIARLLASMDTMRVPCNRSPRGRAPRRLTRLMPARALDRAIELVAEGSPVDWDALVAAATDETERRCLDELRALTLGFAPDSESPADALRWGPLVLKEEIGRTPSSIHSPIRPSWSSAP